MSNRQRIKCCHCGCRARIRNTEWKSASFAGRYLTCSNPECGQRRVMTLTHSHTLTPSALRESKVFTLIDQLTPQQKKQALEMLSASV